MSSPGYVDYARVNLAGGYLLAKGTRPLAGPFRAFTGYVGAWPFVNFFWNAVGATDSWQVELTYWSDSTYTESIAIQYANRNGNLIAWNQYAILSPWLTIDFVAKKGTNAVDVNFAFYGTSQGAPATRLASLDAGFVDTSDSLPASGSVAYTLTRVVPCLAVFTVQSTVAHWYINMQRYNFDTDAYEDFWIVDNNVLHSTNQLVVAMPDTPVKVNIQNLDSSTGTIRTHLWPIPT